MESVHFWTEMPKSFIAPTYIRFEAIKLSGLVIILQMNFYLIHFLNH